MFGLGFSLLIAGILLPELFKQVRGSGGIHFHHFSSKSDRLGTSSLKKTEFINFLKFPVLIFLPWALEFNSSDLKFRFYAQFPAQSFILRSGDLNPASDIENKKC